ncbi:MAG TPA: histidine phosphatase family protein [Ilumatobacteraceae bacterium]|nr:histidine phosphatase family protein [Ilumatobacteraceae bacterium]
MSTSAEAPPTTLVLIRHGESNVTVNRIVGGFRTCTGLSPLGHQQAERLRQRLTETGELAPDVLITSDFPRAIETADAIAGSFAGLGVEVDAGFGEHDPGPEIDGMTFVGYVERFGSPVWNGDPHHEVFPGGETTAQFQLRVGAAISRTVRKHAGRTIVVACHGGVVDAAFRLLLRSAPTGSFELQTLNTSITEFRQAPSGTWQLIRYNDAAHLSGLPAESPRIDPAPA